MLSRFLCDLNADDVPDSNLFPFWCDRSIRWRLEDVPSSIVICSIAKSRRFVRKKRENRLLMEDAYISCSIRKTQITFDGSNLFMFDMKKISMCSSTAAFIYCGMWRSQQSSTETKYLWRKIEWFASRNDTETFPLSHNTFHFRISCCGWSGWKTVMKSKWVLF